MSRDHRVFFRLTFNGPWRQHSFLCGSSHWRLVNFGSISMWNKWPPPWHSHHLHHKDCNFAKIDGPRWWKPSFVCSIGCAWLSKEVPSRLFLCVQSACALNVGDEKILFKWFVCLLSLSNSQDLGTLHAQVWHDRLYVVITRNEYPQRIAFQLIAELKLELEEQFEPIIATSPAKFALNPRADMYFCSVCAKWVQVINNRRQLLINKYSSLEFWLIFVLTDTNTGARLKTWLLNSAAAVLSVHKRLKLHYPTMQMKKEFPLPRCEYFILFFFTN
jgi:hypothetical protein